MGDRAKIEAEQERAYFHLSPNLGALVDLPSFMGSVARLIGCEPNAPLSPGAWLKYMFLPDWACNYRRRGPGANPAAVSAIFDQFSCFAGLSIPLPLLIYTVFFYSVARVMNVFTFLSDTRGMMVANSQDSRW